MEAASAVMSEKEKLLMSGHLNCPVCLDLYKRPRSLACWHSFCEECINSVIKNNAEQWVEKKEIKCPVCQIGTPVPTTAKTMAEWAKELPLNSVLIQKTSSVHVDRATASTRACDPCAAENEISDAEIFCEDCNEYLCRQCVKVHTKFTAMKNHTIFELKDMRNHPVTRLNLGRLQNCKIHEKKEIKYFCHDHSTLCCSACAIVAHRKCDEVIEVKEFRRRMKENNKDEQLQSNMANVQKRLDDITEKLENNVDDIGEDTDRIQREIRDIRDKIVKRMDQIVLQVSSQCEKLKEDNCAKLTDKIARQKSLSAAIVSSRSLLESVLEHGSEAQIVIALNKMEDQYKRYDEMFYTEQGTSKTVKLQMKMDAALEDIINTNEHLTSVSASETKVDAAASLELCQQRITEEGTASDALLHDEVVDDTVNNTQKDVQGNHSVSSLPPIVDCKIQKITAVDVERKEGLEIPFITDIEYLPNGYLALADYSNSHCCLINRDQKMVMHAVLPSSPCSLTFVSDSVIALSLRGEKMIQFVSVGDTLTLSRTIACTRKPFRIACISETELAVGWWEAGVGIISLKDGKEKMYLDKDTAGREIKIESHNYIAVDTKRSRFYQTCRKDNAMYCFGFDRKPLYSYRNDKLDKPAGITLDRDGNIYICSWLTNNVHQVSPEGTLVKIIDVDLLRPNAICFSRTGDQMAVVNNISDKIPKLAIFSFFFSDI